MHKQVKIPKSLTTVTLFSKLLAVILIFTFILAGVYGGMLYQRIADETAFSQYIGGLITGNGGSAAAKTVTLADNGKTLDVHVGDVITFNLGSVTQRWTLSFSTPILKRITLGIAEKVGQAGRYVVVKDGTVVVTGTGVPICATGTMCPMYATHFVVTLVASK